MAKTARNRTGPENDMALAATIDRLTEEVRVLRMAVDELREDVQWGIRNVVDPPRERVPARRITSMPLDPCAADFAERVNALTPADLPAEPEQPPSFSDVRVDGAQFERALDSLAERTGAKKPAIGETIVATAEQFEAAMEGVEQLMYCCDKPNLRWYGEPEAPGICCTNCDFPVAHEGDILCWRGGEDDDEATEQSTEATTSKKEDSQQRELF